MENNDIQKTASVSCSVTIEQTAKAVGSGSADVFATPMMIALMERAACQALANANILQDNQTSVGTSINVLHNAASPLGAVITATATITAIDGRKVEFTVTASDNAGEIGNGTHARAIVDQGKFLARAATRLV